MAREAKGRKPTAEKARFELRFDSDVYDGIKRIADEADISVNQLMQGMARWALEHAHVGEPEAGEYGEIKTHEQPGCVWFGDTEGIVEDEEGNPRWAGGPRVFFALDFTERHVVRDTWDGQKGGAK